MTSRPGAVPAQGQRGGVRAGWKAGVTRWSAFGLAWLVAGCSSLRGPHQGIVAPAVQGRVLDAVTLAPVSGARVERIGGAPPREDAVLRHGGEVLQSGSPVRTKQDGRFTLGAVRGAYLLFEHPPALLISLRVEHGRYRTFSTNLDLLVVKPIETPDGPAIDAGDLLLAPKKP